jgi:hypothetical protein
MGRGAEESEDQSWVVVVFPFLVLDMARRVTGLHWHGDNKSSVNPHRKTEAYTAG